MKEEKEISKACFYYEIFVERAYGQYEPTIPGSHACMMRNLMMAENERAVSVEIVAQVEGLLIEIKKQMEEAINLYRTKPRVTPQLADELQEYRDQVVWAVCSDELMGIVYQVIDLTAILPIEMKTRGLEFS